jgi:CBS domain-containing protein
LHQDGIHLPSASVRAAIAVTAARHVMRENPHLIPANTSVDEALAWTSSAAAPGCLVGTPDALAGAVTRGQLEQWQGAGRGADPIGSLLPASFVHVHDDHPIDVVLERLWKGGGLLPVVSRVDVHKVAGLVTAESILRSGDPGR